MPGLRMRWTGESQPRVVKASQAQSDQSPSGRPRLTLVTVFCQPLPSKSSDLVRYPVHYQPARWRRLQAPVSRPYKTLRTCARYAGVVRATKFGRSTMVLLQMVLEQFDLWPDNLRDGARMLVGMAGINWAPGSPSRWQQLLTPARTPLSCCCGMASQRSARRRAS